MMAPAVIAAKKTREFEICCSMAAHCMKIRNQYAHCNWADAAHVGRKAAGLFFADLEKSAFNGDFFHQFRHVNVELLTLQEGYFAQTMEWLDFLNHEIAFAQGRIARQNWPRPPELEPPPLHNPPQKHVPPWLSEDHIALHLGKTLAAQGGPPTPTPAQKAQEQARATKRAKKQANKERADEGERLAKERSSQKPQ
jgi:hypothetical protein